MAIDWNIPSANLSEVAPCGFFSPATMVDGGAFGDFNSSLLDQTSCSNGNLAGVKNPSHGTLKMLATENRPPQSWFESDENPFGPFGDKK